MQTSKVGQFLIVTLGFLPLFACGAKTTTTLKEGPRVYSDLDQAAEVAQSFTLKSSALEQDAILTSNEALLIPLEWSHAPRGTKSFAVQIIEVGTQRILYSVSKIPATKLSIAASLADEMSPSSKLLGAAQIIVHALSSEELPDDKNVLSVAKLDLSIN